MSRVVGGGVARLGAWVVGVLLVASATFLVDCTDKNKRRRTEGAGAGAGAGAGQARLILYAEAICGYFVRCAADEGPFVASEASCIDMIMADLNCPDRDPYSYSYYYDSDGLGTRVL